MSESGSSAARQPRVVIPVKVAGKRLVFAYGPSMPALLNGASAEVIVDPETIQDKYLLKLLQSEQTLDFLPTGSRLLIAVRPANIADELLKKTYDRDRLLRNTGARYVEVVLDVPLRLRLNGAKRAAFSGGACTIPALDEKRAISLNQAFTFISEVFEPERHSHVGNAFHSGLWFDEAQARWSPLEELRATYEQKFREYITAQCRVTSKKQRLAGPPTFSEWLRGEREQAPLPF